MKRGQKYYARKGEDLVLLLAKCYHHTHQPIPKKEVAATLEGKLVEAFSAANHHPILS